MTVFLFPVVFAQSTRQEFLDRLEDIQAADLTAFVDAYNSAMKTLGESPIERREAFFILPQMNGLWQGKKLNRTAFANCLERLRHASLESSRKFQASLAKAGREEVPMVDALRWMVQTDRIYTNNNLNPAQFDRFLGRVASTPLPAMEQWGAVSSPKRGKFESVLELAGFDELYGQSGFRNDVFQRKLAAKPKN